MEEKSHFNSLFWVLTIILIVALSLFAVLMWKVVRSASSQVETLHADPDQLLEQSLDESKKKDTKNLKMSELFGKKSSEGPNYWEEQEEESQPEEEDETSQETQTAEQPFEPQPAEESAVADAEPSAVPADMLPPLGEFTYTLSLEDMLEEEDEQEQASAPQTSSTVAKSTASKPSAPKVTAPKKPVYLSYDQGLLQCYKEKSFPCAWKDNSSDPLIKQYWLRNWQGPVERITYTRNGKILNRTYVTLDGEVIQYKGAYADLYFEDGLLTKIRTFPYDNPDLRDWFLIGKDGKLSACLCGMPSKDCCARSLLYRNGGHRRYCELFPRDTDFCK